MLEEWTGGERKRRETVRKLKGEKEIENLSKTANLVKDRQFFVSSLIFYFTFENEMWLSHSVLFKGKGREGEGTAHFFFFFLLAATVVCVTSNVVPGSFFSSFPSFSSSFFS